MLQVDIEKIVPVTEARDMFNKIVDDVEGTDELWVLTKNGKPCAVVVGVNHLEKLTGQTGLSQPQPDEEKEEPAAGNVMSAEAAEEVESETVFASADDASPIVPTPSDFSANTSLPSQATDTTEVAPTPSNSFFTNTAAAADSTPATPDMPDTTATSNSFDAPNPFDDSANAATPVDFSTASSPSDDQFSTPDVDPFASPTTLSSDPFAPAQPAASDPAAADADAQAVPNNTISGQ